MVSHNIILTNPKLKKRFPLQYTKHVQKEVSNLAALQVHWLALIIIS